MTNALCARELYDWICENPNAAGVEIERLRAVLAKANDVLRAIATKWEGVRADIIPPSVIAIVPLCNELHAAMTGGAHEPNPARTPCPTCGVMILTGPTDQHFCRGSALKSNQDGQQIPVPSGHAGLGAAGQGPSSDQPSLKSGGGQ